jgi:uncharacterized protein with HEPN domain
MKQPNSYDNTEKLLLHILRACNEILAYTNGMSLEAFTDNTLVLRATERCFEIIGEAATKKQAVDPASYPNLSWARMKA